MRTMKLILALTAVLAHRLTLDPQSRFAGGSAPAIVEQIVRTLPVPA